VVGVIPGNAYFVETLKGQRVKRALNGRYLKEVSSTYMARDVKCKWGRWMIRSYRSTVQGKISKDRVNR
jgi:hypothetical protein